MEDTSRRRKTAEIEFMTLWQEDVYFATELRCWEPSNPIAGLSTIFPGLLRIQLNSRVTWDQLGFQAHVETLCFVEVVLFPIQTIDTLANQT